MGAPRRVGSVRTRWMENRQCAPVVARSLTPMRQQIGAPVNRRIGKIMVQKRPMIGLFATHPPSQRIKVPAPNAARTAPLAAARTAFCQCVVA